MGGGTLMLACGQLLPQTTRSGRAAMIVWMTSTMSA
jgi:hypothetical protein